MFDLLLQAKLEGNAILADPFHVILLFCTLFFFQMALLEKINHLCSPLLSHINPTYNVYPNLIQVPEFILPH